LNESGGIELGTKGGILLGIHAENPCKAKSRFWLRAGCEEFEDTALHWRGFGQLVDRSVSDAIARRLDFCDMNFAGFRFSHAGFVAAHAQRARKILN
jgi:hypothetical protein